MQIQERYYYAAGLVSVILGALFILSSCVTIEKVPPTPYASPIQEVLYSNKESFSIKETGALVNTRWRIVNIRPNLEGFFKGTEFTFEPNGILVESAELPSGTILTDTHRYRVLGSTLILTKGGRTGVALYKIEDTTMNIDCYDYSLTLEKVSK